MKFSKLLFVLFVLPFLVGGCETVPFGQEEAVHEEARTKEKIDLKELEHSLKMERSNSDLGYRERIFDTCKVGSGYNSHGNCRSRRFVSLNFQILCRDTVGTVSSAPREEDMRAISKKRLMYKVGYYRGYTFTDSDGYGQVRIVTPGPSKRQKFLIKIGTHALQLRAGEVKKIVVPRDWCH